MPEPRVRALVAVAESALQCDDRERAEQLLRQAGAYLVAIDEPVSCHAASALTVSAMLRAGLKDEATQVAHAVSRDEVRRLLQECIAPQTPPSEEIDAPITMVKRVEDAEQLVREQCLGAAFVAEVAPEAFGGELKNVSDMVLWTTGRFLLEAGKTEDALKVARLYKDEGTRARVLAEVALQLARGGRSDEADSLFREAVALATAVMRKGEKAEGSPGSSLNEVVLAMASAGKYREALDVIAREGLDRMFSYTPRAQVAIRMAEHGRFQDALKLARSIPFLPHGYSDSRFFALEHIGKAMANAGQYEEAAQVAREMGKSGSSVWMAIGEARIKTGQYEEVFALAREMGVDGASLQIAVCGAAAKEGRYEKAIQLCARMAEPHRSKAKLAVVRQMCERGDLIDAQPLARTIRDAEARDTAFATLASHLARAGNFVEAKRALKEIRDAEVRCQTPLAIANALAKAGRLSDAERMFAAAVRSAKDLKESNRRSYTLSEVATAMAEVASREPFTLLPSSAACYSSLWGRARLLPSHEPPVFVSPEDSPSLQGKGEDR